MPKAAPGAGPHIATEETGIPLMAAIPEARRALEDVGLADEIDLVVAGGIRNGARRREVPRARREGGRDRPLGAHGAQLQQGDPRRHRLRGHGRRPAGQCYHCHTGRCPVGITTQDPELRKRLVVEEASERVYNFLTAMTMELQMLARACGKTNVHSLEPEDLAALTVEASAMARVPLAGTTYTVGQTEREILAEVQRLLAHQGRGRAHREPDRAGHRSALGGRMSSHDLAYTEPEKIKSLDAEFLAGQRFPYQEDMSLVEDIDLMAATPGEDINWLEDIALLEEDGMPAVFDRYSNAFLKIYFPIPDGREDEIARKVLVKHLTSGNSYGIQLKADHTKFPQPELGPWVDGSKTVGTDYSPPVLEGWEKPAGH